MTLNGSITQKGIIFNYNDFIKYIGENKIDIIFKKLTITRVKKISTKSNIRKEKLYKIVSLPNKTLIIISRFSLQLLKKNININNIQLFKEIY